MTKAEIQKIMSKIKPEDDFRLVTKSQYVIVHTKKAPVIFDDTDELIFQVMIGNRYNSEKPADVTIMSYEEIESITVYKAVDELDDFFAQYSVTQDSIEIAKAAVTRKVDASGNVRGQIPTSNPRYNDSRN